MAKAKKKTPPAEIVGRFELVPLNLLHPSPRNVRRAQSAGIEALAESIATAGLLQNLNVSTADGKRYEVEAGGRRLAALRLLAKSGRLAKDHPVPCRIVASLEAGRVSLSENQLREAMHPADQFEAFKALADAGQPVEEIAARYGVLPKFVMQRLKLAACAPRLIEEYRAGRMTLAQLEAFTITENHDRQLGAWEQVRQFIDDEEHARSSPDHIRGLLTETEVPADDRLARYVGLAAYREAGGEISQDLFAEEGDGDGLYLTNYALLRDLALAKLERKAKNMRTQVAWVDCIPGSFTFAARQEYVSAQMLRREPSAGQAARLEEIERKLKELYQGDEITVADAETIDSLEAEREEIEEALIEPNPAQRHLVGAVLAISTDGKAEVFGDLIRKTDAKEAKALEVKKQQKAEEKPSKVTSETVAAEMREERLQAQEERSTVLLSTDQVRAMYTDMTIVFGCVRDHAEAGKERDDALDRLQKAMDYLSSRLMEE